MCFAPYNLQEVVANLKNLLNENMELIDEKKTWLLEGNYIVVCDELKISYERCESLSHVRNFSDWELEDQLEIKNFLSEEVDIWVRLTEHLNELGRDDDEIMVRKFHHNGILYYKDDNNIVYDYTEHEKFGNWIPETGEIILIH